MTYAFIGLGNMAGAILSGMVRSGNFADDTLIGYDADEQKTLFWQREAGLRPAADERSAADMADVIVLAVKPQVLGSVLPRIAPVVDKTKLVLTIIAGKPLQVYADALGQDVPVVRVLPNLNARAGASATAVCANRATSPDQLAIAVRLFEAVGSVVAIDESQAPVFLALAGAAPAFAFLFVDALAAAGVRGGMSRNMAQNAAVDMLLGSATITNRRPSPVPPTRCAPRRHHHRGMHAESAGFEHAVRSHQRRIKKTGRSATAIRRIDMRYIQPAPDLKCLSLR